MENKIFTAMLIHTDGYSIDTEKCESVEQAREKLKEEYKSYLPIEEEWEDMSWCDEDNATLYQNGETVHVWTIVETANAIPRNIWNAIVNCMDDDIREQVHRELAPCSNKNFLRRYVELDADFKSLLKCEFGLKVE